MKALGVLVIASVILLAIGWALAPFALIAWFAVTHSVGDIVKALIIGYIVLIPVSAFCRY